MTVTLSKVSSKYGAPMGRYDFGAPLEGELCSLARIPLDSGGYDGGGAYWGIGRPLFRVQYEAGEHFFRAADRFGAWQTACEFFKVQIRVRA